LKTPINHRGQGLKLSSGCSAGVPPMSANANHRLCNMWLCTVWKKNHPFIRHSKVISLSEVPTAEE